MILDTKHQTPVRTVDLPSRFGQIRHAQDDPLILSHAVMRALNFGLVFHKSRLIKFSIDRTIPARIIDRQELDCLINEVVAEEFLKYGIRKRVTSAIVADVRTAIFGQCLVESDVQLPEWLKV